MKGSGGTVHRRGLERLVAVMARTEHEGDQAVVFRNAVTESKTALSWGAVRRPVLVLRGLG